MGTGRAPGRRPGPQTQGPAAAIAQLLMDCWVGVSHTPCLRLLTAPTAARTLRFSRFLAMSTASSRSARQT